MLTSDGLSWINVLVVGDMIICIGDKSTITPTGPFTPPRTVRV
jgi:hypothetical protein